MWSRAGVVFKVKKRVKHKVERVEKVRKFEKRA